MVGYQRYPLWDIPGFSFTVLYFVNGACRSVLNILETKLYPYNTGPGSSLFINRSPQRASRDGE